MTRRPLYMDSVIAFSVGGLLGYLLHDKLQKFLLVLEAEVLAVSDWTLSEHESIYVGDEYGEEEEESD